MGAIIRGRRLRRDRGRKTTDPPPAPNARQSEAVSGQNGGLKTRRFLREGSDPHVIYSRSPPPRLASNFALASACNKFRDRTSPRKCDKVATVTPSNLNPRAFVSFRRGRRLDLRSLQFPTAVR